MKPISSVLNEYAKNLKNGSTPAFSQNKIYHTLATYSQGILKNCFIEISSQRISLEHAKEYFVEQTEDILALLMKEGYANKADEFLAAVNSMYEDVFIHLEENWDERKGGSQIGVLDFTNFAKWISSRFMSKIKEIKK